MNFEPASEGFLDFFKKKSKQPSKVEKSNILDRMKPGKSINYEEISQKLSDMYPEDAKKEFDNRKKYLKTILNAITEVSKKYKNIPGIDFDYATNMLKCFISGKDFTDSVGLTRQYNDFFFMNELLPAYTPKEREYTWAYDSEFCVTLFEYDIWEWANNGPYKDDFKSGKKIVRDFDGNSEYWGIVENIMNEFKSKLKSSEFFYAIDCGGDWDNGTYEVTLKPSKSIQSLAERCSKYKTF